MTELDIARFRLDFVLVVLALARYGMEAALKSEDRRSDALGETILTYRIACAMILYRPV